MNISTSKLQAAAERDGAPSASRPSYVDEALEADRVVGFKDQAPVVPHPDGACENLKYGESDRRAFEHYPSSGDLFRPDGAKFLRQLVQAEQIDDVNDMASELSPAVSASDVERALELHGIDAPESEGTEDSDSDEEDVTEGFTLPSGEVVAPDVVATDEPWRSTLALSAMLSCGMGVGEIARYVTKQRGGVRVDASDVREAAREAGLLGEPPSRKYGSARDPRRRR